MPKPLIYVAGALNAGDAPGYLRNVSRMIKTANLLRQRGFAVYVPALDLLEGIADGGFDYSDYFDNSQPILDRVDAVFVTPKSEKSIGTANEIKRAALRDIPVYHDLKLLDQDFNRKKKILCIVGHSGSGKTTMANYMESKYGIPVLKSYTDRDPRTPVDTDHTFLTIKQFDELKREDMIAFTEWNGHRYCCLHSDLQDDNIYVIDEKGLCYLQKNFGILYDIYSVFIDRSLELREMVVPKERLARDEGKFFLPKRFFDFKVNNNGPIAALYYQADMIVKEVFID